MANPKALDFIASVLLDDKRKALVYADIVALISGADVPFQNQLINALKNQRTQKIGDLFNSLVDDDLKAKSAIAAVAMLDDDTLDSAEIDLIFK